MLSLNKLKKKSNDLRSDEWGSQKFRLLLPIHLFRVFAICGCHTTLPKCGWHISQAVKKHNFLLCLNIHYASEYSCPAQKNTDLPFL
jgi:hypothetical protein